MSMAKSRKLKIDEIGRWSEVKLAILKKYACAYSQILTSKNFYHMYIDGFAGAGRHLSKATGQLVPGSPLNALQVQPPFRELHLIDLLSGRVAELRRLTAGEKNVHVHDAGDANKILLNEVFPLVKYEDYRRALCVLDPYGLHLNWSVVQAAGAAQSIEIFINFPVLDMNRNVLWWQPGNASHDDIARMNAFWGDESWRDVAYSTEYNLFKEPEKQSNDVIAQAYKERLKKVAGFKRVPEPVAMKNKKNATLYYLFFASQKDTAEHIVLSIFDKLRRDGEL